MGHPSLLRAVFFASGAAALGLQIVWTKMFAAGLGHEVPAMLAVVGAFFGGMALGAWTLDRRINASSDPGRVFAWLQFVIGGWAAVATLLLPHLNDLAIRLIDAGTAPVRQALVSFALPFLALLPATAAMGATLPAMEIWLTPVSAEGRALARVYAWNTAGAVAGALGTAFLLAPKIGFLGAAVILAGINIACGAVCLWVARRDRLALQRPSSRQPSAGGEEVRAPLAPPMARGRLLATAFVTGLLGIGFEVLGVRVLAQALENTLYTFAAVLAVYLLGTALGAAVYQRLRQTKPFRPLLAKLLCALALACLAETAVMARIPPLYAALRSMFGDHIAGVLGSEFMVALAVFLLPTMLMGATFSHLVAAAKTREGGIGRAAAVNTLGGAAAGAVFGVALLPAVGAKWALAGLSLGYLLVLPTLRGRLWLGVAACGGMVFALPADLRLLRVPPDARVRDYREGVMAAVAVLETPDGHRSLRVNNRFQMGGTAAALAQRRQAHLPLLLHAAPKRALFLGPGTGITLGAATEHPGLAADGVELVPEVIEVMRHFEPENRGPFVAGAGVRERGSGGVGSDPTVIAADARRFVRASQERHDVIVADLFHPAQDGAGFLYTREHFAAVRARLAPGGLFCQWLPLHQLDEPTLRVIVRTFLDTFSHTHAFLLHFNVDIPALALVGALEPLKLPSDWLEGRTANSDFRQAMKQAGFDRTLSLLGCHVAGPKALAGFAGDAPLNTDNFPRVTFAAPRFAVWREARADALLLGLLPRFAGDPRTFLRDGPEAAAFGARLADYVAARDLYLRGLSAETDGKLADAMELFLDSTRRSLYFTPAYARLVNIIQVLAKADRSAAKNLFDRLQRAQPDQPLGQQLLGPLLNEP